MGKSSKLLEWAPFIGLVSRNRKKMLVELKKTHLKPYFHTEN